MKLVILASGKGSRLNQLTKRQPKCLVKVNKKPIIDYQNKIFPMFNEVIVVVGFQKEKLINKLGSKVKFIENVNYIKTNMVHSLFCPRRYIDEDIIFIYSDIIFDPRLINRLIYIDKTVLPLNINWLENWKKRMSLKEIYKDAENIKIKNNKIISIGEKIHNMQLPRFQYMGIMKIKNKDYHVMSNYYKKLKNKGIDFTSFINSILKNNIVKISYTKSNHFWTEIDTMKDLKAANNLIKKEKSIIKW